METDLNKRICAALRGLDPIRVENPVFPGTPDINYRDGWIESKQLDALPKRAGTIVKVEHYVPEQRSWHIRRQAAGGTVWVALDVRATGETFVWHGREAAQFLGVCWTAQDMRDHASYLSPRWNTDDFRRFFLGRNR